MKTLFKALVAATLVLANAPARAQDREITVLSWGFMWELGLQEIADNFTAETGIKVNALPQTESTEGLVKLQAMKDNPTVDVWFTTSSLAARAEKDTGLFAAIPADQITNAAKLIGGAQTPSWVAAYYYPLSIAYRPDLVEQPITEWADLWREDLKGKIAAPTMTFYPARLLLVAALINGGGLQDVEPGFAALAKLSANVALWYNSDSDARKALAQGEAAVIIAPPTTALAVKGDGTDVTIVSPNPTPVMFDVMMALNTPRKDDAIKFIDYVVSAKSQGIVAAQLFTGPVNTEAAMSPDLAAVMPAAENQVTFDEGVVNDNITAWGDRFVKDIAQ